MFPDKIILILLSFLFPTLYLHNYVHGDQPQVPCYFIFGDSFVDPGNNNRLLTQLKSNYAPYGVDFLAGSRFAGRFTNNRTIADIIGELMGLKDLIPPFANLTGEDILKGVNYASGGSGIRDESGRQLGDRVSMNEQLKNHFVIVLRTIRILRNVTAATQRLGRCIYTITTGNNDYVNNYFMPNFYSTSRMYTPQQYADVLVEQFSQQLKLLYASGGRKVAVFGVGLLGQAPEVVRTFGANSSMVTAAAQLFSNRLLPLVISLNAQLPGAKFTYINTTGITITSAASLALLNTRDSCCPLIQNVGTCVPGGTPCRDRSQYAFFDGFHQTDIVNSLFASRAYDRLSPVDASPYDIRQLTQLP